MFGECEMTDVLIYFVFVAVILLIATFADMYIKERIKKKPYHIKIKIDKRITIAEFDRIWKECRNIAVNIKPDLSTPREIQDYKNFLREHRNEINWMYLCSSIPFTEDMLYEFENKLNYASFQAHCIKLPPKFVERYIEKFHIGNVLMNQDMSEEWLRNNTFRFKKREWTYISRYQKLSESFIEEFKNKVNWERIVMHQNVSREFVDKFNKKINWQRISMEKQTEEFLEKYKDKILWMYATQENLAVMSDDFILKMEDYVEWRDIWLYKAYMSHRIKAKAKEKLGDWIKRDDQNAILQ